MRKPSFPDEATEDAQLPMASRRSMRKVSFPDEAPLRSISLPDIEGSDDDFSVAAAATEDAQVEEKPATPQGYAPFLPKGLSENIMPNSLSEKVLNTQIPGYGTMAGEPPPGSKLQWFGRGNVFALVQELCVLYSAYIFLVGTTVTAPFIGHVNMDAYFPCGLETEYIDTYMGSIACEYTKTYVYSFPQLALASLLLMVGRDFVQKRFYYFMLKNGGVMSFMPRPLLRDTIVVANIWAFAHFCFFCLLVAWRLWLSGVDPRKAATQVARATVAAASNPYGPASHRPGPGVKEANDPVGLQLLVAMLVFLGLPGVLFMMKFLGSYDIELTLVPLSEYIRDTNTGSLSHHVVDEDAESDGEFHVGITDLGKLVSMKDTSVHALVQVHSESIFEHKGKGDHKNRYEEVLELYTREGWYKLIKEPERLELLNGLWPAPFVTATRRDHSSEQAVGEQPSITMGPAKSHWQDKAGEWSFNAVWQTYRQTVLVVCLLILVIHMYLVVINVRRCFTEHWQAMFSLFGLLVNMYFVGNITHKFYLATPKPFSFFLQRLNLGDCCGNA